MFSTSNSGNNKIAKALHQVENAERLIASLPRRYYNDDRNRELIRTLVDQLRHTADLIRVELYKKDN